MTVGITREGEWLLYRGGPERIANGTWRFGDCVSAALSPNRGERALLVFEAGGVQKITVDAVFPVLHGENGEDGTVQGLCELAGIPLVGCGTLASALGMDKDRSHRLAALAGVRVPRSFALIQGCDLADVHSRAQQLGYPLFVKPAGAGSSFGVSRVAAPQELESAVREALRYGGRALVEECIPGFEVGVAIMGNRELTVGEVDEIELADGFFDFTEKYQLITSKIHVPARIEPEKASEIKRAAEAVYRALGCRGFARVDLFLTPAGEIVFNEINTIPGFTAHSRFPGMMRAAGLTLAQVVARVIELAVQP